MVFKKRKDEVPGASSVDQCDACFKDGLNCTQALLSTYGPQFGLERESALKVAAAFGSGMGMGETCGAVTGALMVIGLKNTKVKGLTFLSKEKTTDLAQELVARFKARHGVVLCRELLGCDVSTPEGRKMAKAEKYFKQKCPAFVHDAAEIVEELLKE